MRLKIKFTGLALILTLFVIFSVGVSAFQQDDEAPAGQFSIPPEIEQAAAEWPMANRDYANTRAVFDSAIDSSTIDQLEVAWTVEIEGVGPWGAAASNPIILNGVVYLQDLASNVYAIDFETGDVLWMHEYDNPVVGPNGPGAGYGMVFAVSGVDTIAALDMETGAEVWSKATSTERPTGALQPYVFDNIVYAATQAGIGGEGEMQYQGYAGGLSGYVLALEPETGETLWEFQVVEEGFWGNPEINSGGGLWYPPGIDTETGVTYWGTGNPAPFPGTVEYPSGTSRPGPNLYTNSMLAFDHSSGELLWYNQVRPHDLFDLDFQISPVLATVGEGEEQRDIAIGSGKLGVVYALDRSNGDIVWERPVGLHQNDDLQEIPPNEVIVVYPGQLGGVETPIAYADNTVYVLVGNAGTPFTSTGWGSEIGPETVPRQEGRMSLRDGTSEVVAIDASTGEIQWLTEFDTIGFGGATVINDLVLTALYDGTIVALSREDGSVVWEYNAPGGINAWPAVTGDTIIFPIGIGSNPVLLALRLGGEGAVPTPEQQRTPVSSGED